LFYIFVENRYFGLFFTENVFQKYGKFELKYTKNDKLFF